MGFAPLPIGDASGLAPRGAHPVFFVLDCRTIRRNFALGKRDIRIPPRKRPINRAFAHIRKTQNQVKTGRFHPRDSQNYLGM